MSETRPVGGPVGDRLRRASGAGPVWKQSWLAQESSCSGAVVAVAQQWPVGKATYTTGEGSGPVASVGEVARRAAYRDRRSEHPRHPAGHGAGPRLRCAAPQMKAHSKREAVPRRGGAVAVPCPQFLLHDRRVCEPQSTVHLEIGEEESCCSCGSVPRRKSLWVMICGVSVETGRHYKIIRVQTLRVHGSIQHDARAVPKSQKPQTLRAEQRC